jgi:dephospho-CoA kinase
MEPIVIGVAGGIGSGKTEFARVLATRIDARSVSFGDFVRSKAAERGLENTRESLQELGERLIAEMGWEAFATSVITPWDRTGHLVVDGVRHVDAVLAVRAAVMPAPFRLVYLDVDVDTRKMRLTERPSDARDLSKWDAHPTEREVHSTLQSMADLVLDARLAPEVLVDTATRLLGVADLST